MLVSTLKVRSFHLVIEVLLGSSVTHDMHALGTVPFRSRDRDAFDFKLARAHYGSNEV